MPCILINSQRNNIVSEVVSLVNDQEEWSVMS